MEAWLRLSYLAELLKDLPVDCSQLAFSTCSLSQQSLCLIISPPGYSSCHGNPSALLFSADNSLSQTPIISYLDYSKGLFIVTLTESHTHLTILHTAVRGIILKCKACLSLKLCFIIVK